MPGQVDEAPVVAGGALGGADEEQPGAVHEGPQLRSVAPGGGVQQGVQDGGFVLVGVEVLPQRAAERGARRRPVGGEDSGERGPRRLGTVVQEAGDQGKEYGAGCRVPVEAPVDVRGQVSGGLGALGHGPADEGGHPVGQRGGGGVGEPAQRLTGVRAEQSGPEGLEDGFGVGRQRGGHRARR